MQLRALLRSRGVHDVKGVLNRAGRGAGKRKRAAAAAGKCRVHRVASRQAAVLGGNGPRWVKAVIDVQDRAAARDLSRAIRRKFSRHSLRIKSAVSPGDTEYVRAAERR